MPGQPTPRRVSMPNFPGPPSPINLPRGNQMPGTPPMPPGSIDLAMGREDVNVPPRLPGSLPPEQPLLPINPSPQPQPQIPPPPSPPPNIQFDPSIGLPPPATPLVQQVGGMMPQMQQPLPPPPPPPPTLQQLNQMSRETGKPPLSPYLPGGDLNRNTRPRPRTPFPPTPQF